MALQNILPDSEVFFFGELRLHGHLQQITDTDELDVAEHRILKRDGAIIEPMGWKARRFQATVVFFGSQVRRQVTYVRDYIRKTRTAESLVHPLLGNLKCFCVKVQGQLDIPASAETSTQTLDFIEAGIDQNFKQKRLKDPPAQVSTKALEVLEELESIEDIGTWAKATVTTIVAGCMAFIEACMNAFDGGPPDPSLWLRLEQVRLATEAIGAALIADGEEGVSPDNFEVVSLSVQAYGQCVALYDAILYARPQPAPYIVPAPTSVYALAAQFYGTEGLTRVNEILTNNPQIRTPHLIPSGTVLTMAPRTV